MTAPTFVMTHRFDAPPELVWRTWTEPDLVKRWYGPGLETEVHLFDPTPGGLWLHEMMMGDKSMFQRIEYVEVTPPSKLVMLMANADARWNIIDNPMVQDWPRSLLTTVTFADDEAGTLLTLEWTPHEASEAQNAVFQAAMENLHQGWGKGMEVIGELLAEMV